MMKTKIWPLIAIIFLLVGCNINEDFNFSLQYNVNGDDKISTFDNSFKVNTVEGYKTIDLALTKKEKEEIKAFIIENNILEEDYTGLNDNPVIEPWENFALEVHLEGEQHLIKWNTNNLLNLIQSIDPSSGEVQPLEGKEEEYQKVKKLYDFRNLVVEIIYNHRETEGLPPHIGYQ